MESNELSPVKQCKYHTGLLCLPLIKSFPIHNIQLIPIHLDSSEEKNNNVYETNILFGISKNSNLVLQVLYDVNDN